MAKRIHIGGPAAVLAICASLVAGPKAGIGGVLYGSGTARPTDMTGMRTAATEAAAQGTGSQPLQPLPAEPAPVAEARRQVDAAIDEYHARMIEMNDWMYHNPESGFLEFRSSKMLAGDLEQHGFVVEWGVPGLEQAWPEYDGLKVVGGLTPDYDGPPYLPTAFRAKYKGRSESPVIAIVVEYDALRAGFHGCQHNMQGPVGLGAAIALARVMDERKIPGSVWVIGAPAEEVGPPPKAAMARANYLEGADFALRSHGTSRSTGSAPGGFSSRHIVQHRYTFKGEEAHAQRAWGSSANALNGVQLFFHAIDMLRQHSEPQFRFHGVITEGGAAPNVIPGQASTLMWVRHLMDETPTGRMTPAEARKLIETKVEQMNAAARGAAMATGTTVEIERYGTYVPAVSVGLLNDLGFHYAVEYGGGNIEHSRMPSSWEETGMLTVQVPGIGIHIGNPDIPPAPGHSPKNADITISPAGHENLKLTAQVMAATALRLVMDPELADRVKAEHAGWVEKYGRPETD
jgi:amidohydrolase